MWSNLLRRPSEVLVRFSPDILAVRASQLREISGPGCNSDVEFLCQRWVTAQVLFLLFPLLWTVLWTKLYIYIDCVFRRCYTSIQQLAGPCSSLRPWACLCIMSFQLADGANPGPDYLGSTGECRGPGGDSYADNGTSMSWLLPVLCSVISLFATWVVRKWWEFLPPATTMGGVDYASLRSTFDLINRENNCLRQEVSSLNGALSELFSIVGRLREDLDGITADHDRLVEQVGWQHAGMVRLGGFTPYQSLSIQQRQQVFARERRNMMAYRAMGPDRFMSTVLQQDRLLGLQSDFNVVGGVGAILDLPQGGGNYRHPTSH